MKGKKKGEVKEAKFLVASQWQLVRWKFLRHKLAVGALIVLGVFYFCAIFAEFVSPDDPRRYEIRNTYHPPQRIHFFDQEGRFRLRPFIYGTKREVDMESFRETYVEDKEKEYSLHFLVRGEPYRFWGLFKSDLHLFGANGRRVFLLGTNKMGQDMLSRIIYGGRISLSIGLVGIALSFLFGITIGGIAGYYGGTADLVIQRVIEFVRSIPTLPLWMALSVALPPYWSMTKVYFGIVIILSLMSWTALARVVRGKFMSVREEDFVMAAKLNGAGEARIITKHLLPSFYSYIIASLTLSVPAMILGETALSFLGLGLQPPAISWGVLLKQSQAIRVLAQSPWLLIPGMFVIVTVLVFNFVGDGLRDAADPYANV